MPDSALDLRTLLLKPTSRGHMELMLEAELMASSPEAVAAWLKARAEVPEERRREAWRGSDEELELALLSRREPLIDLALARFGGYEEPQRELFWRHPEGSGSFEFALPWLPFERVPGAVFLRRTGLAPAGQRQGRQRVAVPSRAPGD